MTNKQAVLDFFAHHAKSSLPTGDAALAVHYLDEGLIDSLGIVTLISELEAKLGVQFSAEDMQSYEFQTVGGLIGILDRLTGPRA
jgi:acyl carrier protein